MSGREPRRRKQTLLLEFAVLAALSIKLTHCRGRLSCASRNLRPCGTRAGSNYALVLHQPLRNRESYNRNVREGVLRYFRVGRQV